MLIAESWYESGSFWQFAITTLVAVAVGALGAFATMRAANPKRRLVYSTPTNASLFAASHARTGALQVTHQGTPVSRPRVVELELRNAGRRDITAAQFHNGEALSVNLGADVVGVLDVRSTPSTTVAPSVDTSSSRVITIPPTLLVRKQVVRLTVLVDGPRADVTVQAPLTDVDIREGAEPDPPELRGSRWLGAMAASAVAATAITQVFSQR
jgi:hypothetical protein